ESLRPHFSPDGKTLAAGLEGIYRLWDVASGRELQPGGHRTAVDAVTFSPDGKILATAGTRDGSIRLWDTGTGREIRHLQNLVWVDALVFSRDGKQLMTNSLGGAQIWDVPSGKLLRVLKNDGGATDGLALSPDGSLLAVADEYNRTIKL